MSDETRRESTPDENEAPRPEEEGVRHDADGDGPSRASDGAVDRRTFLRAAGVAGAGAALGFARPSEVAGDAASPSELHRAPALHLRQSPDVVVVGAGAFGVWTAFWLTRMGATVTLVDQYGPGNSRATSGGETRGVRTSYGDRDHGLSWVRWADEAIRRWNRFDEEWQDRLLPRLFYTTGDLILREDPQEPYLIDTQSHWDEVGVSYEVLDADEVKRRWPVVSTEGVGVALYEHGAGVVRARRACEAVATVFEDEGGALRIARAEPGPATGGSLAGGGMDGIVLDTGERLRGGQYVFAVGPWFPKLFPELMGRRLRIPIGHVVYFATPPGDQRFTFPNLPSYGVPGCTGWPALPGDNRGFRVRTGGRSHDDPDFSPRRLDAEHVERPRQVLAQWFPDMADAPVSETRACHYELSMTRNFIIDHHPDFANAWLVGGGSAEAFKFGPVSGEYVAKRVLGKETDPELDAGFRLSDEEYDPPDPGGDLP